MRRAARSPDLIAGRAMIGVAMVVVALTCLAGCDQGRDIRTIEPSFEGRVGPLLQSQCAECHSGDDAEAGWRVDTYLDAIGCVADTGEPVVLPADESAPLFRPLDDEDHRGLLSDEERATLLAWLRADVPARHGAKHPPGIVDPRSPDFHGRILREERWARMLSTEPPDACGRCHAGAPARLETLQRPPPQATSCVTCHDGPDGVLSCDTCHGYNGRAYPPSDPCFRREGDPVGGAHAVHIEGGDLGVPRLDCTACHPERDTNVGSGAHGDGVVDVELDPAIAGEDASYDAETQTCSVACHDHGGDRSRPLWTDDEPLTCSDCHLSPPEDHNPASCDSCHAEANADGTELSGGPLHLNGRVDLGDGSGRCGFCHGEGDDPWPDTGAHQVHRDPDVGPPLECETCHVVPEEVDDEGHIDDQTAGAEVVFDLAIAGPEAVYDAATQTCSVACHDRGGELSQPAWTDEGPLDCSSCHLAPPEPHNPASCDTCHVEANADGTELSGGPLHLNGVVDVGDGTGECGFCHGSGDDPWPSTGAHRAHMAPTISAQVDCSTCHLVPQEIEDEGHIDDQTLGPEVTLGGLASARGATPTYSALTCQGVACHGEGLPSFVAPPVRWDDETGAPSRCGACHSIPPPPPHVQSTTCESLLCHGSEISQGPDGPRISGTGRAVHIDGDIDVLGVAP